MSFANEKIVSDEYILDYQEFYEEFKEGDYLSSKIDLEWLNENDGYLREVFFAFYRMYTNNTEPSSVLRQLFKLYADTILYTYLSFNKIKFL